MKKKRKTLVAKLLAATFVCATALCACEEDIFNDNTSDTELETTETATETETTNPDEEDNDLGDGVVVEVNGVSFKMIKVEGGTFTMGATEEQGDDAYDWEKPTHQVTLSDYYIGETEVTQALWEAVMGENPSEFAGNGNRPVEMVSWDDCRIFISRLNELTGRNFKLPTEAQWEYAARGGNQSQGYKYAGSNTVDEVAWYDENSASSTHPVKQKAANELGLYDMSGNVLEWCSDWYGVYDDAVQTDPQGHVQGSYRVLRGGSWRDRSRNMRVSDRSWCPPDFRESSSGLRLAL